MSTQHQEELTCPKCGARSSFTVYDSLDGGDAALKEKLLDGSLFTFTCPRCGGQEQVSYYMLYYDLEKHLLLSLVGREEEAAVFFDRHSAQLGQLNYIQRLVGDQSALREKALLFQRGLDDRLIELIKVSYQKKIAQEHPELNLTAILYAQGRQQEDLLLFYSDGQLAAAIDLNQNQLYQRAAELYGPELPPLAADKTRVIDGAWAIDFLNRRP